MRLLPRIVLAITVPVVLGTGAVLYVLAGSWQRALENELVESARRAVVARVDAVPAGLQSARDTLRLLARAPALREGNLDGIRRALQEWNRQTTLFEGFYFTTPEGLAYPAEGAPVDIRDRSYYPLLRRGDELMAEPLISRFSGQPILLMLVPVRDDRGRLLGALGGTMILSTLLDRVVADAQASGASFLLLDRSGRVLAGSIAGEVPVFEIPESAGSPATTAVVSSIMAALGAEEVRQDLRVPLGDDVLRVLHAPVPALSWRLAYVQPESRLLAPIAEARGVASVVVVAAALAALVLALLLHRLILRPVRNLTASLARLSSGESSVRAAVRGNDEFSEMAASFNALAENLQHSENRFRAVFQAAPYAVSLLRLRDGAYLDVNPAFERNAGCSRDEVVGHTPFALGFLEDTEAVRQQAARLLETGRLDNQEVRGIARDGTEHWTLYSSRLVEIDGEAVALSMSVDISSQKAVEEALRESQESFTALFDLAPIPMAYCDEQDGYRATRWNEAWYARFGYARADADRRSGADIGLWVSLSDREAYLAAAFGQGDVSGMAVQMRRQDGRVLQVELYGRFIRAGGRRLLVTAYVDVTEQRAAEAALRARELWLRSLFEVSPVAVLVVDLQGVIRESNQRFLEMLERPQEEVVGHLYLDFVHPSHLELARQGVGRMLHDPELTVFSSERAYVRRDGSPLFGLLSARRVPAAGGGEDLLLVIISDISELRKVEAQRLESETKLQAVFNATPTAMIVSDVRRNYASVAANDAWERQFLRRRSDVMGMTGAEMGLWASIPDRDEILAAIARDGRVDGVETRLVRGDGVELVCRISARRVTAGDAELLVMVQEDVTGLRQAEASLQSLNAELARQLALSDAVARAQSDFIADAAAVGAFESLLADLLNLSDSEYGFIGEVLNDADGAPYLKTHAITNIAWDDDTRALYAQNAWQGLEFHNMATLFGAAIVGGEPVIANDPATDPRRGGLPAGHPAMRSFLGLPIRAGGQLVAMAGIANRPGGYDAALVAWLQPLLLTIGQMVEVRRSTLARRAAEEALRELNEALDARVQERTGALERANAELAGTLETLRRAQGELVRSEKLAALGSLVAGVAHELNTPIGNSVTVASTLVENSEAFVEEMAAGLKRSVLLGYVDRSRKAAELLLSNLQRAANLVSSFKQVAVDQTSEQRRRFDVAEVIDEILAMLYPQLKKMPVTVRREIAPELVLDGYPGPFGQVVANLVNNATIHAFGDDSSQGLILISASAVPDGLRLVISDNGAGIPPEHIDRIFDPFFTTRLGQGGSGLGLNIVYNIVTGILGGRIHVESRVGEGTAFIVELPAVAPEAPAG